MLRTFSKVENLGALSGFWCDNCTLYAMHHTELNWDHINYYTFTLHVENQFQMSKKVTNIYKNMSVFVNIGIKGSKLPIHSKIFAHLQKCHSNIL